MQAFLNCKKYSEYLKVLEGHISNGIPYLSSNEDGFSLLCSVNDINDQKKIINIFKLVDRELSQSSIHNDEMWKKIDYFLVLGRYYHLLNGCFDNLSEQEIFVLLMGEMSFLNDSNKQFVRLFSNRDLLDTIYNQSQDNIHTGDNSIFGYNDYFFMMEQHYDKKPFDLDDQDECDEFIRQMILKIKTKTLHEGVMNMVEYWESNDEIREIVLGGKPNETR